MSKRVNYVVLLTVEDRIRHYHEIERGEVIGFAVQYETFLKNQWFPVLRFDTAHGFAHLDIIHFKGKTEKVPLGITDFNAALTFAQNEIRKKWSNHKKRFVREFEDEK